MIKAVCFDWFNTLAYYQPSREEVHHQVLQEFGITLPLEKIARGLQIADKHYFEENAISPIRQRNIAEQARVFIHYQETVLTAAGVELPETDVLAKIMRRAQQLAELMSFVLFDDVLPTLKILKKRRLILGILTNLDKDMKPLCQSLGLEPYINFIVTSSEAGADKPQASIFKLALKQAGVKANEAVHVGDQYQIDCLGAKAAGISPIFLDRQDANTEVKDCPRIRSLLQLGEYLN